MTAIVGWFDGKSTWLAADGIASVGNGHHNYAAHTNAQKLFQVGSWLVGHSGDMWVAPFIRQQTLLRDPDVSVESFCSIVRQALTELGYRPGSGEQAAGLPNLDQCLVLARPGECWTTSVEIVPNAVQPGRVFGIGNGQFAAMCCAWGALHHGAKPAEAVVTGILGASDLQVGIGGRILVASNENGRVEISDL